MARTGRPPVDGASRTEAVCVRFTNAATEDMDTIRGKQSRSDFVREAVEEKIERSRR